MIKFAYFLDFRCGLRWPNFVFFFFKKFNWDYQCFEYTKNGPFGNMNIAYKIPGALFYVEHVTKFKLWIFMCVDEKKKIKWVHFYAIRGRRFYFNNNIFSIVERFFVPQW